MLAPNGHILNVISLPMYFSRSILTFISQPPSVIRREYRKGKEGTCTCACSYSHTFSHGLPKDPVCLVINLLPSIWPASLSISLELRRYSYVHNCTGTLPFARFRYCPRIVMASTRTSIISRHHNCSGGGDSRCYYT